MEAIAVLIILLVLGLPIAGLVLGIVAITRASAVRDELRMVRGQIRVLQDKAAELAACVRDHGPEPETCAPSEEAETRRAGEEAGATGPAPAVVRERSGGRVERAAGATGPAPVVARKKTGFEERAAFLKSEAVEKGRGLFASFIAFFQENTGTRVFALAGAILSIVGLGFFLKYLYDNSWIDERGRIAIGTFLGTAALGAGEYARRRDWRPLFQSLSGIGVAAFYLCVFFAFRVYALSGQPVSLSLAVLVTVLAVVLAVAHNAAGVALVGLLGGFMSPVLLSTGENHPYMLFTYIAILNLVAIGAGYFRRWRALDLLCFIGTVVIYTGWHTKFYDATQMTPALLFITLFYLMFLLIPSLHCLVRRRPLPMENAALITGNALFSLAAYFAVLYEDSPHVLSFVVLGQAAAVFALFQVWHVRLSQDGKTAQGLLVVSLALVTLAIPIRLEAYAVAVAWAVEAVVLTFLGRQHRSRLTQVVGIGATGLAVIALLGQLPMHRLIFIPIVNIHFAAWAFVGAAAVGVGVLHERMRVETDRMARALAGLAFLTGYVVFCVALSVEAGQYWDLRDAVHAPSKGLNSLAVLWAVIAAATLYVIGRQTSRRAWLLLPAADLAIGALIFLVGLTAYKDNSPVLLGNATFLSRLTICLALWYAAFELRRTGQSGWGSFPGVAGHTLLVFLVAFEFLRWGWESDLVSGRLATSMVSAAWALHAVALIWLGFVLRDKPRRVLGAVIFAVAVAKVCLYDMTELEPVYRIVSFMASGGLALVAAFFYQRYAPILLDQQKGEQK